MERGRERQTETAGERARERDTDSERERARYRQRETARERERKESARFFAWITTRTHARALEEVAKRQSLLLNSSVDAARRGRTPCHDRLLLLCYSPA